jgi:hypothetical protein
LWRREHRVKYRIKDIPLTIDTQLGIEVLSA